MKNLHTSMKQFAVNRRNFLIGAAAFSGLAMTGQLPSQAQTGAPSFSTDPFTLGVASGDPLPDGVVLWTRLAPDPLNGGGMGTGDVKVRWQVFADEGAKRPVREGEALAAAKLAHSVHVEVKGLESDRWYWYRFTA